MGARQEPRKNWDKYRQFLRLSGKVTDFCPNPLSQGAIFPLPQRFSMIINDLRIWSVARKPRLKAKLMCRATDDTALRVVQ